MMEQITSNKQYASQVASGPTWRLRQAAMHAETERHRLRSEARSRHAAHIGTLATAPPEAAAEAPGTLHQPDTMPVDPAMGVMRDNSSMGQPSTIENTVFEATKVTTERLSVTAQSELTGV